MSTNKRITGEPVESIVEKICPICGRNYCPAPLHSYKLENGRLVCSWSCLCRARREKPDYEQKRRVRPVLQFDKNHEKVGRFESAAEAERTLGIDQSSIRRACAEKWRMCGGFFWRFENEKEGD